MILYYAVYNYNTQNVRNSYVFTELNTVIGLCNTFVRCHEFYVAFGYFDLNNKGT